MSVSPRDAAAAAAIARASPGASKLHWGASHPAKTMVEHKAEDGTKSISGKGSTNNVEYLEKELLSKSRVRFRDLENIVSFAEIINYKSKF